jgi:hypothetical protein
MEKKQRPPKIDVSVTGRIPCGQGQYLQPDEVKNLRLVGKRARWERRIARAQSIWRGISNGTLGRTFRLHMVKMKNNADRMLG